MKKYLLGFDIGSSSVKAALLDVDSGLPVATTFYPSSEMPIEALEPGFAEQHPELWWKELLHAVELLYKQCAWQQDEISAIGIAYQMHGLVCVDKNLDPLRPSIIWCDSRSVNIGNQAFSDLGANFCLSHYLNSPGNFTASKLKWVKENEPALYEKIYKVMLPGDYIALKMSGEINTTISGLSEGILWDFEQKSIATDLLQYYEIDQNLLPEIKPTFGVHTKVSEKIAELLHIKSGTPISYRAGDQPNNAWSLNVLNPGEIAATAGTSGVVYGVTDQVNYDPLSRVNSFAHVNHTNEQTRLGILLCINGTGILNSWLRKQFFQSMDYAEMNQMASTAPAGSEGLLFYPFGNGAERVLENANPGAALKGLSFNRHNAAHIARAAQEGIVFSLHYGMEIMQSMGMQMNTVKAGFANMFLSDIFASAFSSLTGCTLELYNTDGAVGAARGAGLGAGIYSSTKETFEGMHLLKSYQPDKMVQAVYQGAYENWKKNIN